MKTVQANEALAIEVGIFRGLKLTSRALVLIPALTLVLSIIVVAAALVIVMAGKGKDKIVFLDSSGRPSLIRVDDPDKIHWPELEVFCKDSVREILAWTYVEVKTKDDLTNRINRISKRFDPASFQAFYEPFRDNYLKSVSDQKLVVGAEWMGLKDSKLRGNQAIVVAAVRFNAVRVIGEEASGEDAKIKTFEMKIHKGARSVENP
ncbi:MAG: hypothetical protein ACYDHW_02375, partial [Syntrophorhabdaceae bacterium]